MMARIKRLETELAELKVSIPQIQHDAIIEAIRGNDYADHDGERIICQSDLVFQARQLLTTAQELKK